MSEHKLLVRKAYIDPHPGGVYDGKPAKYIVWCGVGDMIVGGQPAPHYEGAKRIAQAFRDHGVDSPGGSADQRRREYRVLESGENYDSSKEQ